MGSEMCIRDRAGDESILKQGGKECFPSCDLPERCLSKAVLDWTEKRGMNVFMKR